MFLSLYLQLVLQNTHLILSQKGCSPTLFKSDDILQAKREQDNCLNYLHCFSSSSRLSTKTHCLLQPKKKGSYANLCKTLCKFWQPTV